MLRFLRIEHLAVIDALEIEFEPGLNVLTGETGAGKSMLVEAVDLLMGGRASSDLIRTGETRAHVEAVFEPSADNPPTSELIVRRDITSQGRSRAFLDDTLVTSAALADRTAPLIELHGQRASQALLDPQENHLLLLDDFCGLTSARHTVADAFRRWRELRSELDGFHMDEREKAARLDLLRFQVKELQNAALRSGEDDELETSRRLLNNAGKLDRLCGEAYGALYDSDGAALGRLATVWKRVAELADIDPLFLPHLDARDAIKSQLEELAFALREYQRTLDAAPERLQQIEDRLAVIERLKRKYGPTLDAVMATAASCAQQLESLEHAGERQVGLEAGAAAAREAFLAGARALSGKRREGALRFGTKLQSHLAELAMEKARFEWRFETAPSESAWSEHGIDVAECYLSANPGEDLRPLARVASGGELSRVMLAIRTLASADSPGKTLIFDEVDAGIGGRVADVVGKKLRRLGESFQVLCITHLPQIAAAGHVHFSISKAVTNGRTHTRVVRLDPAERVEEVARMIAGTAPTHASRAAARELLAQAKAKE